MEARSSRVIACRGEMEMAALQAELAAWRRMDRRAERALLISLLALAAIVCGLMAGAWREQTRGIVEADPRDFAALLARNPDTVAWLMLEDTPIDHPVVQGRDNFEYLNRDFDGGFYAGGTLFLDVGNKRDFSDPCSIIHGHHMAGKAMFSSLEWFLREKYFRAHQSGSLFTPTQEYELHLLAAGVYDAYDNRIYSPGEVLPAEVFREAHLRSEETLSVDENTQVLALSTCTGKMNDDRIVVFWEMTERRDGS